MLPHVKKATRRNQIIYHVIGWFIYFGITNSLSILGYSAKPWPLLFYDNISAFVIFYFLWFVAKSYHRNINPLIAEELQGASLYKYKLFNWQAITVILLGISYRFISWKIMCYYAGIPTGGPFSATDYDNYMLTYVALAIVAYTVTARQYIADKGIAEYFIRYDVDKIIAKTREQLLKQVDERLNRLREELLKAKPHNINHPN